MRDQHSGEKNIIVSGNNNVIGEIIGNYRDGYDGHGRVLVDAHRSSKVFLGGRSVIFAFCFVSAFISILSFTGNVASVLSFFDVSWRGVPPLLKIFLAVLFPFSCFLGVLVFKVGVKRKAISLPFSFSFEGGSQGEIYLTRLKAICPFCGARMTKLPESKHLAPHTLVCERNSQHRVEFDMTTLPDLDSVLTDEAKS